MAFNRQSASSNQELASLVVGNWRNSKAANNNDGGIQSLIDFLNRKSKCQIQGSYVQGDTLIIAVKPSEQNRFTHLNNFLWAGTNITVQNPENASLGRANQTQTHSHPQTSFTSTPPAGPRYTNTSQRFNSPNSSNISTNLRTQNSNNSLRSNNQSATQRGNNTRGNHTNNNRQNQGQQLQQDGDNIVMEGGLPPQAKAKDSSIEDTIIKVIHQRYNPAQKYLILEGLVNDEDITSHGQATASKMFGALFKTIENRVFETPAKRRDMVESLSLSNNSLTSVKDVIAAASTFPNIKNLDLSHNQIKDVGDLKFWRNRFRSLEHLILTGNPVDLKPDTKDTMLRWYPKLQLYNSAPARGEGANTLQAPTPPQSTSPVYPLPTEPHPEFPPGSTFGVPTPEKGQEQLLKEQMGLKFSYETRLKMQFVEACLTANNFDYNAAMADLQTGMEAGNVPADAFLSV